MTFAAGLGVVQRAEAVAEFFGLVEFRQVGLMGCVVHHTVGFVVEASWGVCRLGGRRNEQKAQSDRGGEDSHEFLPPRTNREPGADKWSTFCARSKEQS